jgi:hypothetical protein
MKRLLLLLIVSALFGCASGGTRSAADEAALDQLIQMGSRVQPSCIGFGCAGMPPYRRR